MLPLHILRLPVGISGDVFLRLHTCEIPDNYLFPEGNIPDVVISSAMLPSIGPQLCQNISDFHFEKSVGKLARMAFQRFFSE